MIAATYLDAVASRPTSFPDFVDTKGYSEAGDNGGATYYPVTSEPAHNGKLIITTSDGGTKWYAIRSSTVRPEQFGPTDHFSTDPDAISANTIAIQRAIDYFGAGSNQGLIGGTVELSQFAINNTIHVVSGVEIIGMGWGTSYTTNRPSGYLKWYGAAGIPMIKVNAHLGVSMRRLRFVGDPASKPSCAIEVAENGSRINLMFNFEDIWVGSVFGLDDRSNKQFTCGIKFTGTINSDSHTMRGIWVESVDEEAILITNPNASGVTMENMHLVRCKHAVRTFATVTIRYSYTQTSDYAFVLEQAGKIALHSWTSENSGGILKIVGNGTKFAVHDSAFQLEETKILASNLLVDVGSSVYWTLRFEGFSLQSNAVINRPLKLRLHNSAGGLTQGSASFVDVNGIYPHMLDCGTMVDANDQRTVYYRPGSPTNGQDAYPTIEFSPSHAIPEDRALQSWRRDFPGKVNVFGGPLNVRALRPPKYSGVTRHIGTGTSITYSYRVSALTYDGETTPNTAATVTNDILAPGVAVNKVNIVASHGAYAYRIYGRTPGSELLLATVTWDDLHGKAAGNNKTSTPYHWLDDGTAVPGAAMPTKNTTGSFTVEGPLRMPATSGNGWKTAMQLGTAYLWVSAGDVLRIKHATAPTSDSDGSPV
jgi:hypothetical protein